jgi:hypothetical protein
MDTIQRTFRELFPASGDPNPLFEIAPTFTFALLEGLALGRILAPAQPDRERVLGVLKMLARLTSPSDAS